MSNQRIANALVRHGRLLGIAGESGFRTRAYERAAETIGALQEPLADLAAAGSLRELPGIGAGMAAAIQELLATGEFIAHTELTQRFPDSLVDLLTIPGVGAKTVQRLHSELDIASIEDLADALATGTLKNLGKGLEATIRDGLAQLQRRSGKTPLAVALPMARSIEVAYAQSRPEDQVVATGEVRRWEVAVEYLHFAISTTDPEGALQAFGELPAVSTLRRTGVASAHCQLDSGLTAIVSIAAPSEWGTVLVRTTGSEDHVQRLEPIPALASEAEVYALHGLPWIPPELRSGLAAFSHWQRIPELVSLPDIRGEFHAHSEWSDGTASILAMAEAAAQRGYQFLGISDHSGSLGVANGLDAERLRAQRAEIVAASAQSGIRLLAGAEVEVHRDGRLDYDRETLAWLDVVVASLHSGLRQPRDEITARLVRVLENPDVDIIAHPSGRLIERREGGDFSWDEVFSVAARTGTALEINADPARLDLDPNLARRASEAGCVITINCDAHAPRGFENMEYGVAMARKAWLTPEHILNCWQVDRVLAWLLNRGITR